MGTALQHRAITDPATDEELQEERDLFVEATAAKLLATDMLSVFSELDHPTPILAQLYSCSLPDLISLQLNFHQLMRHEARAMALRRWTPTEEALAIQRIQDGRVS